MTERFAHALWQGGLAFRTFLGWVAVTLTCNPLLCVSGYDETASVVCTEHVPYVRTEFQYWVMIRSLAV